MTTPVPSVILTNRMIIPIKAIDSDVIKKNYDRRIYDLKSCRRCEHRHERHSEYCDGCDSYKGHFVLYKKIVKNGKKYWSLPRAELYRLKDLGVKRYKIVNLMSRGTRLDKRLKITKKPYDYQKKCIRELVEGDGRKDYFPHGILKAAPRSGKCVTGNTIIATVEHGLVPIKSLFDADHKDGEIRDASIPVYTKAGVETVTKLFKKKVTETVRIKTRNGVSLQGTPEHPVLVLTSDYRHVWRRLDKIQQGDFICTPKPDSVVDYTLLDTPSGVAFNSTNPAPLTLLQKFWMLGVITGKTETSHVWLPGIREHESYLKSVLTKTDGKCLAYKYLAFPNFAQHVLAQGFDFRDVGACITEVTKFAPAYQKQYVDGLLAGGIPSAQGEAKRKLLTLLNLYANESSTNYYPGSHTPVDYKTGRKKRNCEPLLGDFLRHVNATLPKVRSSFTRGKLSFAQLGIHVESYKLDIAALKNQNPALGKRANTVLNRRKYNYDQVDEVHVVNKPITVYDVTVPGSHSFIGNGLVVHNTLMSLTSAVKLRRKVLILANQEDLLKQFIIELTDSTNIKDIDKFDGKVSFGMCSKVEDFEKYDICLATYQTFISKKGKQKLKKIRKLFGTVFVDEAHRCAADAFSQVIDSFYAENRFGLTATEKRKDTLDFITRQILGDVVTEAKVKSLIPRVVVIPTGINPKYPYKTWNGAMQFLANNKDRTDLIMRWIKKDLKEGRKIVIPVMFKKQVHELVGLVRKMGYTAEAFIGGMKREELLKKARAGKIDVVVGIRSILATGVNVPCWSVIYTIAPISNPPNYYQETTRICTPMDGKPEPIIRLFVDPLSMTKGCFRTCWTQTILPMKYRYSDKTKEKAKEILSTMRSYKEDSDDEGFDGDGKVYRDASIFDVKTGKSTTKRIAKSNTVKKVQSIGLFKR